MFLEQPVATRPAVRVLYVDDSEFDRDLVRDALEQEHGGFALTETASRQQFESALERDDYDLVLTDFNILGFTGLQVIRLVQSSKPQLPVIVVTGTGSEEVAVEAIKLGAWDYVIKSPAHIRRLPSTIHNVLARHEALLAKARADEELRDSQTRLELALAAGHMGVFDWDMSTGHILWEANHAKLFGLSPGEFDGTYARFARCVHPEDLPEIDRAMQVALDSRSEFDAEYRVVWPDGSVHWIAGRGRLW
jgi:PleD family two-component response regulator